ncbi:MAG TPA: aspartate kinase [Thermoplasmata archaeon]|nr:aspartate kinase [Thermoplasmata archaeon]
MRVIKFGGTCVSSPEMLKDTIQRLRGEGRVVAVVSALQGVTNLLEGVMGNHLDEREIAGLIEQLRLSHEGLAQKTLGKLPESFLRREEEHLTKLERLLYGVFYTEELTPRTRDLVLSFGERLAAHFVAAYLDANGLPAEGFEADRLGLVTDDSFGNATVLLEETRKNVAKPLLKASETSLPVVTGYIGRTRDGHTTTLGRSGSDYSAGALGYAVDADRVEIWKTVEGFMTADPKVVPEAQVIEQLSYDEAAELAYFGAQVLHPRTVEPARVKGFDIWIRNLMDPSGKVSVVSGDRARTAGGVKSISSRKDLGIVKFYASGGGYKSGVMGHITSQLGDAKVNIYSATTSQTCVSLLIRRNEIPKAVAALNSIEPGVRERVEAFDSVSLVCIVGEGLGMKKGLAAATFDAVSAEGVNVNLISAGASMAAFHFTVDDAHLERTVKAVHRVFFPPGKEERAGRPGKAERLARDEKESGAHRAGTRRGLKKRK